MKMKKRILAYVMTVFMILSMLPSMVFAAEEPVELGGKLKFKGELKVESTVSADYKEVTPEGVTDEDVTFKWTKLSVEDYEWLKAHQDQKDELKYPELGTKKEYKITAEDEGFYPCRFGAWNIYRNTDGKEWPLYCGTALRSHS